MGHVIADAHVITKITANPIPIAPLVFLDTPKKGHKPRNLDRTKLFTNIAPTAITSKFSISLRYLLSFLRFLYRIIAMMTAIVRKAPGGRVIITEGDCVKVGMIV
jgi:hypothetical protein